MTSAAVNPGVLPPLRTAVIVCTHNGARFIEQQLASIASQTHAVDELHVFDWKSTDGTIDVVRKWLAANATQTLAKELHAMDTAPGPARSFLHALELVAGSSRADLIFLCDQDDLWMPEKVRTFLESYRGAGGAFDLAFSDVNVLADAGGRVIPTFYGAGSPYRRPENLRDASLLVTNPAIGMTMCLRREWLVRISGVFGSYWIMHDWALMALCWLTGGRARYLDLPLVSYRQHDSNTLGAPVSRSILSRAGHIRSHVADVRRQIASISQAGEKLGMVADAATMVASADSKWRQARIAATSRMLTPRYRVLLAGALAVF
jgi:glycosyltransferase involved in cell wall biosynthesis